MAELVYALALGASARKGLRVRVSLPAPLDSVQHSWTSLVVYGVKYASDHFFTRIE